jgi:hypothetical protein
MIHSQGTNSLQWDVGLTEVIDRGGHMATGRFVLKPAHPATDATMRLDLWNAEAPGRFFTVRGRSAVVRLLTLTSW